MDGLSPQSAWSASEVEAFLSSYRDIKSVNTLKLLDSFTEQIAEKWELDPALPAGSRQRERGAVRAPVQALAFPRAPAPDRDRLLQV